MSADAENHYATLGIDRGADERAIKRAYFRLIRENPPETRPEEFKRIRAAYEVLSDPVARERYDAQDRGYEEYGAELAALLRDAAQAAREQREEQAQATLRHALELKPDCVEALEMLGVSLLNARKATEAAAQLERLIAAQPDVARHHRNLGWAREQLEQYGAAEPLFRKAVELAPDDFGMRIALADYLGRRQRFGPSLAEMKQALKLRPKWGPDRVAALVRCVRLRFLEGDGRGALDDAKRLAAEARKDADHDVWKYVSSELASVATERFCAEQPDDANALLSLCERLNPGSAAEHPYPEVADIEMEDVPEATRRWLAALPAAPASPTIRSGRVFGPALLFLVLLIAPLWLASILIDASGPPSALGLVVTATLAGLMALVLAVAVRGLRQALTSEAAGVTTIHPLYLLVTTPSWLRAWPLFRLKSVRSVRHTYNGAYTHTQIEARFGGRTFRLSIRDEKLAGEWGQHLLDTKARALELMAEGYLEGIEGAEMVPPALLARGRAGLRRRLRTRLPSARICALAVGLGLVAWGLTFPAQVSHARVAAWQRAVATNTVAGYESYIKYHPNDGFAAQARQALERKRAGALGPYAELGASTLAGGRTLLAILSGPRTGAATRAFVTFHSERPEGFGVVSSAPSAARDAGWVVLRLTAGTRRAGLEEVLSWAPAAEAPVGFAELAIVERIVALPGPAQADGTPAVALPRVEWEARLTGSGAPELSWRRAADAPGTVRAPWPPLSDPAIWARRLEERLAADSAESLLWSLARELGIPYADRPTRMAEKEAL